MHSQELHKGKDEFFTEQGNETAQCHEPSGDFGPTAGPETGLLGFAFVLLKLTPSTDSIYLQP